MSNKANANTGNPVFRLLFDQPQAPVKAPPPIEEARAAYMLFRHRRRVRVYRQIAFTVGGLGIAASALFLAIILSQSEARIEFSDAGAFMGKEGNPRPSDVIERRVTVVPRHSGYAVVLYGGPGEGIRVAPSQYHDERDLELVTAGRKSTLSPIIDDSAARPRRAVVIITDIPSGQFLSEAAAAGKLPGIENNNRNRLLSAIDEILKSNGVKRLDQGFLNPKHSVTASGN